MFRFFQQQDSTQNSLPLELLEIEDEVVDLPKEKPIPTYKKVKPKEPEDTVMFEYTIEGIPVRSSPKVDKREIIEQTTVSFDGSVREEIVSNVGSITLFLLVGMLGLMKVIYPTRFGQMVKSIISIQTSQELLREEKVFFHRSNVVLFVVFIVSAALVVKIIAFDSLFDFSLPIIALILLGVYLVKFICSGFLFNILSTQKLTANYVFNVLIYNYLWAFLVLPTLFFYYYSQLGYEQFITYVIIPISVVVLLFRVIRVFTLARASGIFYLYNILYICTLEILPLVVLSKFFILKKV